MSGETDRPAKPRNAGSYSEQLRATASYEGTQVARMEDCIKASTDARADI
jgi:hypothetical protein